MLASLFLIAALHSIFCLDSTDNHRLQHSGSHYEWIRPRDPPESSVPLNPCMISVNSRDTVVFLSGSRLQGLEARSGSPNWRHSLSNGINPIEMWGGDGAVMVASEEGGRIKLYSISTMT